jgi:hypothetical protein
VAYAALFGVVHAAFAKRVLKPAKLWWGRRREADGPVSAPRPDTSLS